MGMGVESNEIQAPAVNVPTYKDIPSDPIAPMYSSPLYEPVQLPEHCQQGIFYQENFATELDVARLRLHSSLLGLRVSLFLSLLWILVAFLFWADSDLFGLFFVLISCNIIGSFSVITRWRWLLLIHWIFSFSLATFWTCLFFTWFLFYIPTFLMWWSSFATLGVLQRLAIVERLQRAESLV